MEFLVDFTIGQEKKIKSEIIKGNSIKEILNQLKTKYDGDIRITSIYKV